MNIYEKIQAVGDAIRNIEKDMEVGKGSYAYKAISDSAVMSAVKTAEHKHRLVSIPVKQELISEEQVNAVNNSGKQVLYYKQTIKMTVEITDLDKTEDKVYVETLAVGLDTGDKGLGKASTYARKYALLNAYKVITGEDPDSEKSPQTESITESSMLIDVTNALAKHTDAREKVFKSFKVQSEKDLTEKQLRVTYDTCVKRGYIDV